MKKYQAAMDDYVDEQDVHFCPHCGNVAPQKLEGYTVSLDNGDGAHNYFLTQCSTCREALLYRQHDFLNKAPQFLHGTFHLAQYELVWPRLGSLHRSVPQKIRRIYQEAALIKSRAPNAFANQIRNALDALCRDRGTDKSTLAQNLKELAERGEIPWILAEATDVLQQLGHIGSDAEEREIDLGYIDAIDDFFKAIIEYVYIAPYKADEFKSQWEYVRKLKAVGKGK